MGLSTKDIEKSTKVTGRRAQVAELRKKHEKLLELEGVGNQAKFIPKMAYMPYSGADKIIAFFPSEIMGGVDIYTEFVNKQNIPEDPERTLYKWEFNPEYDTEYEKSEKHPATGHRRYFIPVDELINVAEIHNKPKPKPKAEPIPKVQTELPFELGRDAPINELTIRDKAAIDWKKPVSDKPWLNELIIETFKEE